MEELDIAISQAESIPPMGFTREQVALLTREIRTLPFAGLVGFLAASSFKPHGAAGEGWIERAANEAAKELTLDDTYGGSVAIQELLDKVFRQGIDPKDALDDTNLRRLLLESGIKHLAKQAGVSPEPEQIQEAIELLETGKVFGDASSFLMAVFHAIPEFPADILKDLEDSQLSGLPMKVLEAALRDTTGFPAEMKKTLRSVVTGSGRDDALVFGATLGTLKQLAVPKRAFVLLRSVLSKNNRSARLAIILFARANGVTVSETTIDKVYDALNPDNPSLGLPLRAALEILGQEYEGSTGIQVVRKLRRKT